MLLMTVLLAGCASDEGTIHQKIHTRYYDMPSYTAQCQPTVISNKTRNTYEVRIVYDSDGERYRIDYDNMSLILTPTGAQIKKDNTVMSLPVDNSYMILLPDTFFKSYYTSENASQTVGSLIDGCTLLECDILNPPAWANSMKLWVDSKTLSLRCMKIFDKDMNEKISIEYSEFKTINKVEENIFEF